MKVDLIADEAAELYAAGLSIEQVAAKLGVAYRTARKAIFMAGGETRGPSERLVGRTRPDKAAERTEGDALAAALHYEAAMSAPFAYSEEGAAQIAALLAEPVAR